MSCYRLQHFQKSNMYVFDDIIDAVFIMTMEKGDRHDHIKTHIIPNLPVSNIYIQFNKGYKICEKSLPKKTSYQDQYHAFQNIFEMAKNRRYQYIMIVEDDCILSEELIHDKSTQLTIANFIKKNEVECYNLGPCMYVPNPLYLFAKHQHNLLSMSTHCCIFNVKYVSSYIKTPLTYEAFDGLNSSSLKCYSYYKPLAYQHYFTNDSIMKLKSETSIFTDIVKFVNLKIFFYDNVANGFKRLFILGQVLSILLLMFCIWVLFMLYNMCYKKLTEKK